MNMNSATSSDHQIGSRTRARSCMSTSAIRPVIRSSTRMPKPPRSLSRLRAGGGFRMSKNRKARKAITASVRFQAKGPIGAGSTPWQCDQSHALTGNPVGRILRRDPDSLVLNTDPFGYQSMTLSGKMISIEASPDSPMPNGLINTLDEGQVGDLWAYLGNSSRPGSGDSHLRKNGQQGQ